MRLAAYGAETAMLSYGRMTYVDRRPSDEASDGKGLSDERPRNKRPGDGGSEEVVLSAHGLYGGYDQAFENVESFSSRYRIIAPSRFGYLGSSVKGEGTPREQAEAYAELLDRLEIERAFVLGASAGGTPAIRFALDFPERTKGLILYCSAAPWNERPARIPRLMGPPPIVNRDLPMWLAFPLYRRVYGMGADVVRGMLPLSRRKEGADLDARITNRDMAVRFEEYPIAGSCAAPPRKGRSSGALRSSRRPSRGVASPLPESGEEDLRNGRPLHGRAQRGNRCSRPGFHQKT